MVNPIKVFSTLRQTSEIIFGDKNRFFKLLKDAKNKSLDVGEFSGIENELKLLFQLSKDYMTGKYRRISKRNIIMIISAFVYLVNPMDIVPDFILGIGFLDDLSVLSYLITKIKKEINAYKIWKEEIETRD